MLVNDINDRVNDLEDSEILPEYSHEWVLYAYNSREKRYIATNGKVLSFKWYPVLKVFDRDNDFLAHVDNSAPHIPIIVSKSWDLNFATSLSNIKNQVPFILRSILDSVEWVLSKIFPVLPDIIDLNPEITKILTTSLEKNGIKDFEWSWMVNHLYEKLSLIKEFLSGEWDRRILNYSWGSLYNGYNFALYANWIHHNQYDLSMLHFDWDEFKFLIMFLSGGLHIPDVWEKDEVRSIIDNASAISTANTLRTWSGGKYELEYDKRDVFMVFDEIAEISSKPRTSRIKITVEMILDL